MNSEFGHGGFKKERGPPSPRHVLTRFSNAHGQSGRRTHCEILESAVCRLRMRLARIIRLRFALAIGLASVILALVFPTWFAFRTGYSFADTWKSVLTTALGECGTRCAPGFSDTKFSKVRIGMSRDEVLALLGEPLERCWPPSKPDRLWCYTLEAGKLTYHKRWISFGTNGTVTGVTRKLYWD